MERVEVDSTVLTWLDGVSGGRLEIGAIDAIASKCATRSAFQLTPADGRIRIGMALIPTSHVVDVSTQPAVLREVLPIGVGACPAGSSGSVAAAWIARLSHRSSCWRPADPDAAGLIRTACGAAFPLLGAAFDLGALPLVKVPRWAAPALAHSSARVAASTLFASKATRPVIAALVRGLIQPGLASEPHSIAHSAEGGVDGASHVNLLGVGLAMMGESVLEPDSLARVLGMVSNHVDPNTWPTSEQIAIFHLHAPALGASRTERLLVDAASRPNGPLLLARVIGALDDVGHRLPRRLASRLDEFDQQCQSLLPVDPNPELGRWGPLPARGSSPARQLRPAQRRQSAARPNQVPDAAARGPVGRRPAGRGVDQRRRAFMAPAGELRRSEPNDASQLANAIRNLNGSALPGGLVLRVPRSGADLRAWGTLLSNCVGSYAAAVASGRSHIVGVELQDALQYCLEIKPDATIRQFLGHRNRAVPREHAGIVCRYLAAAGVLNATSPINQPWL